MRTTPSSAKSLVDSLPRPPIVAFLALLCAMNPVSAQESWFFRIAAPTGAAITEVTSNGYVTWTNATTNLTCTFQSSRNLAANDWVDYVQVPVSSHLMTQRLFDPNPPPGLAFIPAGTFSMGDAFAEIYGCVPVHLVYVSAFHIDKHEVTKALWEQVYQWATNHGYGFDYADSGKGKAPNHPVHSMTWYDAVKWCNARSQSEGRTPCYYTDASLSVVYKSGQVNLTNGCVKWRASGYRLPTEPEWEKAARGGLSSKRFPWGDTITHDQANYSSNARLPYDTSLTRGFHPTYATGNQPYTSPVGSFPPNGYGLYDMAGNVVEWCWDWYDTAWYANSASREDDTRGPAGPSAYRVSRGGAWGGGAAAVQCANRGWLSPPGVYDTSGIRCVRDH